ncbi:MAG: nucleotidyl transferase AbiEii/AbiGii toxin family protein [Acholeplasmatales bacterium]
MKNIESVKAKIRNLSKKSSLNSQEILQMYFFERFLKRLSISDYMTNFVIKGGFLISSMIGVESRTTKDLDTTVKGVPLKEDLIRKIIKEIVEKDVGDGVSFEIKDVNRIMEEEEYENFRVSLFAVADGTKATLKIDITTGDSITPKEIKFQYSGIFKNENIEVLAYSLETILAEKYETIISRNITTTRMRDFYDIYALFKLKEKEIKFETLKKAITNTSIKRGSFEIIKNSEEIIKEIKNDNYLKSLWQVYIDENKYIGNLEFETTIDVLKTLFRKMKF